MSFMRGYWVSNCFVIMNSLLAFSSLCSSEYADSAASYTWSQHFGAWSLDVYDAGRLTDRIRSLQLAVEMSVTIAADFAARN